MIENFKEIAAKILNHEIQGVFTLNCGHQYSSHHLTLETDAFDHKTMFYALGHNTYDLDGRILNCGKEPDSPWAIASFTEFDEKPEPIAEEEKPINRNSKGPSTYVLTYRKGPNKEDGERRYFGNVNTARGVMLTEYFEVLDKYENRRWNIDSRYLDGPDCAHICVHNYKRDSVTGGYDSVTGEYHTFDWTIREIKL